MHVYMYVHMYGSLNESNTIVIIMFRPIYIYIYVSIYATVYTCKYACVYVCIYVLKNIRP